MANRIISADSHVSVQHDDVKAHLASRLHDEYDAALMQAYREMLGGNAAKANQGGNEIKHASWNRPGYSDPHERLRDMDVDGVDVEVLYCEVSAYRYLYLLHDRRGRGDARVQRHAARLRVGGPDTPRRHRTRCRSTTSTSRSSEVEARRRDRRQVAAAAGVPGRARPARLLRRALRPAVGRDPGVRPPGLLPHRAQHRARRASPIATPHRASRGSLSCMPLSACEALGMWLLTGVLERFPELKLVFVEPGLAWVAWLLSFLDDMVAAPGLRVPRAQRRAAELLLPPQRGA